jgi:hypothetical protein
VSFISRRQMREGILCLLRCKFCAACPCIKDLLNLSSRGTMRQTGATNHPSATLRQTMKNRFLSPVTRVFRKRFLTTCLTTDSRGACGNSGVKSCEERPQLSKNGYKAPEKVEKILFKSLGARCREFESPISGQNVLMKDAAQKTPRFCAVFSHIYHLFHRKKF